MYKYEVQFLKQNIDLKKYDEYILKKIIKFEEVNYCIYDLGIIIF